jgi:Holliday junction resolvase RusA-like endonuclease
MTATYWFYPKLPPSSNKIYFGNVNGRRLTDASRTYKTALVRWLSREIAKSGLTVFRDDVPYEVRLLFAFEQNDVLTKGWPKKAKSRFRKADTTNLDKLVLDALATAIGVDDCAFFSVQLTKCISHKPGVSIVLRELPCEPADVETNWYMEAEEVLNLE